MGSEAKLGALYEPMSEEVVPELLVNKVFHEFAYVAQQANGAIILRIGAGFLFVYWHNTSHFPCCREVPPAEAEAEQLG